MAVKRRILAIDDEPEQVASLLNSVREELEVIHPRELQFGHIADASVILVDHHLTDTAWPERDRLPLACQPQNGLALAAIVQAHVRSPRFARESPTAVALLSGRLVEVTPGLENPPEHLAAQASGLDWAFSKRQPACLAFRIRELASAVDRLPRNWPGDEPDDLWTIFSTLLGLGDADWKETALAHIEGCHPPIHELAEWTDGLAVVRWLAQRILPYPTFLVSRYQAAMRLGVRPQWMQQHADQGDAVIDLLQPAVYRGILANFLGPRWWGAGLDYLLWTETGGRSLDSREVKRWIEEATGSQPEWITDDEVLTLDDNLCYDGTTASYSEALQIHPDDWPPYASRPWTSIDRLLQSPRLRGLVGASDLERFKSV